MAPRRPGDPVIPAQAGIHSNQKFLDSRSHFREDSLRGNDGLERLLT